MALLRDYFKEREITESPETYLQTLISHGINIEFDEDGFMAYKAVGDALVITDAYTVPNARKTGVTRRRHDKIKKIAQNQGCRVMITFSAKGAKKRHLGLKTIASLGYQKAQDLEGVEVYMRGTH